MQGFPPLLSGSTVMRSKWFMPQRYPWAGPEVKYPRDPPSPQPSHSITRQPDEEAEYWQAWDIDGPNLEFTLTLPEGEELLDAAGDCSIPVRTRDEFDARYLLVWEIQGNSPGVSQPAAWSTVPLGGAS